MQIFKEFMRIGVPSGCHEKPEPGVIRMKKEKSKWMDQKGFITGVRSRFFKNNYYAWEVPQIASSSNEPYIAGAEEVGNDRRSR